MKKITKLIIALSFCAATILPPVASTVNADAATTALTPTGYTSASQVVYKTYTESVSSKTKTVIANWGARDEDCTFLSTYAQEYYTGSDTYANWATLSGSSSQSSVPDSALFKELQSFLLENHDIYTGYQNSPYAKYLLQYADCVRSDISQVSLIYSGKMVDGEWDGTTRDQEHTWPKSKLTSTHAIGDFVQLRSCHKPENSSRGNKAYGESSGCYNPLYTNTITNEGVDTRGDVARIVLYMYVHYNEGTTWGSSGVMESVSTLFKWMEADPVDTW